MAQPVAGGIYCDGRLDIASGSLHKACSEPHRSWRSTVSSSRRAKEHAQRRVWWAREGGRLWALDGLRAATSCYLMPDTAALYPRLN